MRFDSLDGGLQRALAEIREVKESIEKMSKQIGLLSHDVIQVRADQVGIENRMDAIETRL